MAVVISEYDRLQGAQLGRTFCILTAPLCQRDFWGIADMPEVQKRQTSTPNIKTENPPATITVRTDWKWQVMLLMNDFF